MLRGESHVVDLQHAFSNSGVEIGRERLQAPRRAVRVIVGAGQTGKATRFNEEEPIELDHLPARSDIEKMECYRFQHLLRPARHKHNVPELGNP